MDLSIDYLTFLRFYGFDKVAQKVSGQNMDAKISYQNLHEIFLKMGLIPFNIDIRTWAIDLSQGMNSMKSLPDPNEDADVQHRMVNGWKALQSACVRISRQIMAVRNFKNVDMAQNYITLETPDRKSVV